MALLVLHSPVVGLGAPEVRGAVDGPREVEHDAVADEVDGEQRVKPVLVPQQARDVARQDQREEHVQGLVPSDKAQTTVKESDFSNLLIMGYLSK